MRKVVYLIIFSILSSCSDKPKGYIITGMTSDIADNTMIYLSNENGFFDSTFIINNKFKFKGHVEGEFQRVAIHTKGYKDSKILWLVNDRLTFDATQASFNNGKVIGSEIQDQYEEWNRDVEIWDKKADSIRTILKSTKDEDPSKLSLEKTMERYREKQQQEEVQYILDHPDYHLSSYYLTFLKNKLPEKKTNKLFQGLEENVKSNKWGQTVAYYLKNSKDLKLGDVAIDFSLPNHNGDEISLSSFQGKYVLLEFWAKWCKPCRQENPNLVNAYKKFNDDGFEIVGVNLDENKKDWLDVVVKDSIIWTTVSDLQGFDGKVALTYRVAYLPKNYFIDPTGKIIAQDLSGDELQNKLNEIFSE